MDFEKAKHAAAQASSKATAKASAVASTIREKSSPYAHNLKKKAGPYAETVKKKTGPYAEKASAFAAKGVTSAASAAKKVTGGRYDTRIDSAADKIGGALKKERGMPAAHEPPTTEPAESSGTSS